MFGKTISVFRKPAAFLMVAAFLFGLVVTNVAIADDLTLAIGDPEAIELVGGVEAPSAPCGIAVGLAIGGLVAAGTIATGGLGFALLASIGLHATAALCI